MARGRSTSGASRKGEGRTSSTRAARSELDADIQNAAWSVQVWELGLGLGVWELRGWVWGVGFVGWGWGLGVRRFGFGFFKVFGGGGTA